MAECLLKEQQMQKEECFKEREKLVGKAVILCVIIFAAWCTAFGKWTTESWSIPAVYDEPIYSDFIGSAAVFKSIYEEGMTPFCWKTVHDLGAPGVGGWNRFPTPEEVQFAFFAFVCRLTGLFTGINILVCVGHMAAALTFFYVAANGFRVAWPLAFVGGLAFGLAPYQFAQQPHHLSCQYVWYLPFFPLVWKWLADGEKCTFWSKRFWQIVAISFLVGLQNPYYTNIFCQLVIVIGLIRTWKDQSWSGMKPPAIILATIAFAFLLSNLDTLTYRISNSSNVGDDPIIGQREYKWMDVYGLKMVDFFIPPVTHHSDEFLLFGRQHRVVSILSDEEGSTYLGLMGISCFFLLLAVSIKSMIKGRAQSVPVEAWWILWIVLMFTTGGMNAIIASFTGFTLFRTATRYSILVLLLSLIFAGRFMTLKRSAWIREKPLWLKNIATLMACSFCGGIILWDQVPRRQSRYQVEHVKKIIQSDKTFVESIEESLLNQQKQQNPMVFQLPVMDGTPSDGLPASSHYRPYLYSKNLHFSHGSHKSVLKDQLEIEKQIFRGAEKIEYGESMVLYPDNVERAVKKLIAIGFDAIYINLKAYNDRGKALEEILSNLGFKTIIESDCKDLLCIVLH